MGLQVRLRHALGERLLDFPDRPAESPLMIGRAREAEVKIPSVTVTAQHCALFVHDGQWILQDMSGGSTWVNGNAIAGPTPLSIGDVITLGSDATPASVEIDPAGVAEGRTGDPAESNEAAPTPVAIAPAPVRRPATAKTPAPRSASPAGNYAPVRPPPVQKMPPPVAAENPWGSPPADDSIEGWGQPVASTDTGNDAPVRRRKPQRNTSAAGLIVGIMLCIVIIGGTSYWVYKQMHVPPPSKPVVKPEGPTNHPTNIFDAAGSSATPSPSKQESGSERLASAAPAARRAVPAQPKERDTTDSAPDSPASSSESADPHKDDKAWSEVEGASFSPEIGLAILKFDDYRKQHPGAFTKELDAYTDDAMDRLWWKRISTLCAKRDSITKDIKKAEKDIRDEPTADFKKKLGDEKKALEASLALAQEHLASDMGYIADDPPDLDNKDVMAKLTAQRDASKFGAWKVRTIKYIRTNHGATPWDGE